VEFYKEALRRCNEAEVGSEESREVGLVMEWIWHVVFGEEMVVAMDDVRKVQGRVQEFDLAVLSDRPWCVR